MSIVRTLCCFLAGIIMAVPLSAQVSNISGRWQGALAVSGINLRIVLNVTETAGGVMSATMDSPDQGATGLPVNSIIVRNDSLLFTVEAVRGTYSGRFAPDRTTISGEWTQGSVRIPLEFRYTTEVIEQKRRQDPVKPYPYSEQEVTFSNPAAGITLAGTLTLPASEGPFPAVVLISGSGPQNRDGMILGHRPFLVIADYLTRRGIAVLDRLVPRPPSCLPPDSNRVRVRRRKSASRVPRRRLNTFSDRQADAATTMLPSARSCRRRFSGSPV